MLGLAAEEKLLIKKISKEQRKWITTAVEPAPKPIEVNRSLSADVSGFGIRPIMFTKPILLPNCKILFHWLCQFGVNTCVK